MLFSIHAHTHLDVGMYHMIICVLRAYARNLKLTGLKQIWKIDVQLMYWSEVERGVCVWHIAKYASTTASISCCARIILTRYLGVGTGHIMKITLSPASIIYSLRLCLKHRCTCISIHKLVIKFEVFHALHVNWYIWEKILGTNVLIHYHLRCLPG